MKDRTSDQTERRIVLHIITGLEDGGAEAALYRLCCADTRDEHHVISLTGDGKYGPLLVAAGIPTLSLGMPRGRIRIRSLWRLWRTIRQLRPRAVQTWMYHSDLLGGVMARLAGVRNISWGLHHTALAPGPTSRKTIAVARFCALLSSVVPRNIICCARKSAEIHSAIGYRTDAMRVIPNGYDLGIFRVDSAAEQAVRSELGLANGERILGFVARFDPLKDHAGLLQALHLLQRRGIVPRCLLVGTGMDDRNRELREQIAALNLDDQVRLLGRREDIPAIMNALDLHVMSSAAEAFPNVLAEAMACGTPCVSTDVGDARFIIGDTGWIAPPQAPDSLADAIEEALHALDGPDGAARAAGARDRIRTLFTIDKMVESYRAVWFGGESKADAHSAGDVSHGRRTP
ncbi:MAG: glycosyltransferase [Sphingopyxis sp.]